MFGKWKIAKAILLENESEIEQSYHDTDMEIRVWTNKKKKGKGKRVAIVTLTKTGDIFTTSLHKNAKKKDISRYQIEVAKAFLQNIRNEKMPNWDKHYPYNKKNKY